MATAENGRQALEMLRAKAYDLVLLDIEMPELDGFQVLEALLEDPELRYIPVIMTSASDELDRVVKCIEMGAEDLSRRNLSTRCCCRPGSMPAWRRNACGISSAGSSARSPLRRWRRSC